MFVVSLHLPLEEFLGCMVVVEMSGMRQQWLVELFTS